MDDEQIISKHPRAKSLQIRARLAQGFEKGVTSAFGLFAHGRGEAFDYLIGEKTTENARKAIRAAAACLISAKYPVLSVNGNVAALTPRELVELAKSCDAKLEVNLYHRSTAREMAIAKVLREAGAQEILGINESETTTIPEIHSDRRHVDQRGLYIADVAFVPLEDGDRTEALVRLGKRVITVDLNPLSRTAQSATITIVDNIIRALPHLIQEIRELKSQTQDIHQIVEKFDNQLNLREAIILINEHLSHIAEQTD